MRLLPLAILVVIALTVFFTVRAIRARRRKHAFDRGWFPQKLDIGNTTYVKLMRYGHPGRIEAAIPFDDPDYSNRVIEAFAAAEAKADEWNSTHRALLY